MGEAHTVLVVDDQPGLLDLIKLTLEIAGYGILTARDGIEALEVLESHPVDLILADIAMPRMNGYQLYERLIENPRWVTIPFLFLTARALDSDIRYGKELGVDDYLTKPVEPEDLLAAVHGKLRRMQQVTRLNSVGVSQPMRGSGALAFGQLRIDPGQHRVWRDGSLVELSAREFRALTCLAQRAYQVTPLQDLIKTTHNLCADYAEAAALLRPVIRSLHRKLGYPTGDMGCIENVRGVGYRFAPSRN